ncbi:Aste57867_20139 [Aphanomyces stellatus]|uniref:Aste57867_20139 protein n=1 Tax=Aphanomyces stellatus TaxID=120398 RepID=A0A485LIY6_9STRA|nr:hypothetical protein As57867_020073 [Aphanomyces stellatus]VFT96834.1 Aste57867_20139 [Aphanomyces stellatus]
MPSAWSNDVGMRIAPKQIDYDMRPWIDWGVGGTNVLSAIGSLFMIVRFARLPKLERDATSMLVVTLAAVELIIAIAKAPATSFVQFAEKLNQDGERMLVVNTTKIDPTRATMCQIQAFTIDVFILHGTESRRPSSSCRSTSNADACVAELWHGCMAYNLLRWVVYRDSEEKLQSRFWVYFFATSFFCVAWGLSAALPIWTLGHPTASSLFGFSWHFCWMKYPEIALYRFLPPVVLVFLFIIAVFIKIRSIVLARAKQYVVVDEVIFIVVLACLRRQFMSPSDETVVQIQRRLFLYVVAFFVLYTPTVIFRFLIVANNIYKTDKAGFLTHKSMQYLGITTQLCISVQGVVNAIIYGGFLQSTSSQDQKLSISSIDHPLSVYLEESRSNGSGNNFAEGVSIFASTFNMAEGAVPSPHEFAKWIPAGHNVYVIGVQECLDLPAMRFAMATHLRKLHGKSFVEYGREIGRKETVLGYHGFIAITVYVSAEDVDAGHFHMHLEAISKVNRGKNLMGLGRASNKGAVGFAFRYFNSTFAVVTCHLTSDSTGKSKIKKRHQDGTSILSDMHLQAIDNEFDCHLMAHHTIFMGDLNYRLTARDASPDRILNMITAIVNTNRRDSSIKRGQVFSHDQLMPKGYHRSSLDHDGDVHEDMYVLTTTPSGMANQLPTPQHHPFHHHTDIASQLHTFDLRLSDVMDSTMYSEPSTPSVLDVTWKALLEHDELKRSMDDGIVFHDFDEAMIAFAPTYRRVLHSILDPKLPWTVDQVAQLYTVHLGDGKVRVPSYTDRILFHSLPGLRDRFVCVDYRSAEFIGTSDHKPVSCVFEVFVDKPPKPSTTTPRMLSQRRMPPPSAKQLEHFSMQLTKLTINWGPPLDKFSSDEGESDSSSVVARAKAPSHASNSDTPPTPTTNLSVNDGLRVRSVFPLPCEDEFAEERKLTELADHLLRDNHHQTKRGKLKPTWKVSTWAHVVEHGLKQSVVLAPRKHLHAALNIAKSSGETAGQCVISLSEAGYRLGRKVDFIAALTVGGRRVGDLAGKVSLVIEKVPLSSK